MTNPKNLLIEWLLDGPMLVKHIQNGVARELYSQDLANLVFQSFIGYEEVLTEQYVESLTGE